VSIVRNGVFSAPRSEGLGTDSTYFGREDFNAGRVRISLVVTRRTPWVMSSSREKAF
jgi:hypothetical protein